uniref:Nicastrin n=1 Tax=Tetradesmus obliquus TaxID=3088 RepID=A0A383VJT7_TETOB|eukprot:jgi/Sobl393_1/10308/SZX64924.1
MASAVHSNLAAHVLLRVWLFGLSVHLLATSQAVQSKSLEDIGLVTTVKALSEVMYREMKQTGGCYKLLNATGPVGSQGDPDYNLDIDAPLVHASDLQQPLQRDVAVLLPVKQSVAFMQQLQGSPEMQQHIKGLLFDDTDPPASYSTVGPFPGGPEYAPYNAPSYVWNKAAGANSYPFASSWFPMPVFLLTPELAADAQQRAAYNAKQDPTRKQYHARMKLAMAAATSANSADCISQGTCKPLGGYSVWAALPPLPAAAAAAGAAGDDGRPIILVVAQMDSIDMFHDSVQGADGPLSGLVSMLTALHALHSSFTNSSSSSSSYSKRIVFMALAGEPWGYMGSRRLLWEAASGSNSTAGLNMSLVEQVIEVGQGGRLTASPAANAPLKLYAHSQQGPGFGNSSSMLAALQAAAQGEASSAKADVLAASPSNPGIPPSSLMSFLRVKPSIQGLVLAEFDDGFINPYFGSRFDNGSTVNADGIASVAAVLAAAVHRLAGGEPAALKVNMTELQQVAASYAACIIMPTPGFACPTAAAIMAPDYTVSTGSATRSYAPRNYIGVLQYMPEVQAPLGKSNLARFVWNLMAFDSSDGAFGQACDHWKRRCQEGQVCAGWRSSSDEELMGRCVNATVRYVPSYSTRVSCESCSDYYTAKWQLTDVAEQWSQQYSWPDDPLWAESDWPVGVPDLQLYLHEAEAVEVALLVSGLLVTVAVGVASLAAKAAFHRHH